MYSLHLQGSRYDTGRFGTGCTTLCVEMQMTGYEWIRDPCTTLDLDLNCVILLQIEQHCTAQYIASQYHSITERKNRLTVKSWRLSGRPRKMTRSDSRSLHAQKESIIISCILSYTIRRPSLYEDNCNKKK